jgi:hypothetical protein
MKRLIVAVTGTAIVFFTLGVFTPQWVEQYRHRQDIRQIADDCNKTASQAATDEARTHLFRECFNQSLTALVEASERYGASRAGDLARKLD